jgi:hypothetical protein
MVKWKDDNNAPYMAVQSTETEDRPVFEEALRTYGSISSRAAGTECAQSTRS